MGIYTKTGDKGTTALVGGSRVEKIAPQVETYGTVDELNAAISLAQKALQVTRHQELLDRIQFQLFYLGAELAAPNAHIRDEMQKRITDTDISALERAIDNAMAQVPPVHSFVLPGRCEAASRLHLARAIARRAERRVIALSHELNLRPELIRYLNRLSDALYALARREDIEAQLQTLVATISARYQAAMSQANQATTSVQTDTTPATCAQQSTASNALPSATQQTLKLLNLAVAKAQQIGIPIVFALVDRHGNTIIHYRMPGALLVSTHLALQKAYSAAALKMPTHELHQAVQPGQDLYQLEASCSGKIVSFGGGYPIFNQQQLIGAIGISGGSVEQDMQIAQAALQGI